MPPLTPTRPQLRFVAGALAAVAVLAAGFGYRVAGRGALDATLTRVSGSDEALAGFTLFGQTRHETANALTTFTLQNGVFTSETSLDTQTLAAEEPYFLFGGVSWAVAPSARGAANAAAAAVPGSADADGLSLTSEADRFRLMLHLSVPGRGSVQLPIEEIETPAPVTVSTELQGGRALYDWLPAHDALPDGYAVLEALSGQDWTFTPDAAYFAMPADTLAAPAGLCRVTAAPDDVWQARENETAIEYGGQTYPASDAAATVGAVETVYAPADAANCVMAFAAGERLGLVYVTADNIVQADLVDAAGNCTASVELMTLAAGQTVRNCLRLPQQRASDAAFLLCYSAASGSETAGTETADAAAASGALLCLLRVEDGAPTVLIRRPQADDGALRYADLSDDGERLLTVRINYTTVRYASRGTVQQTGLPGPYGVAVSPAGGGEPLYTGLLDAGQDTGLTDRMAEHDGDVMLYTPAFELEPTARTVLPDLPAPATTKEAQP